MRAKRKVLAKANEGTQSTAAPGTVEQAAPPLTPPGSAARAMRTSAGSAGGRFTLLLAAMMSLCGTGYLVVDALMSQAPGLHAEPVASTPAGAGAALDATGAVGSEAGKEALAPAAILPLPAQGTPASATPGQEESEEAPVTRSQARQRARADVPAALPFTSAMLSRVSAPDRQAIADTSSLAESGTAIDGETAGAGPAALRHAAVNGDPAAQAELATRFAEGKGVPQDYRQAAAWYQRAASRGYAPAQFRLASFFERGIGIEPDLERARIWYQRAAEQGHARAMHNLAVLAIGQDPKLADYTSAAHWFAQAAERGLSDSQFNLGLLHESGRGVARDGSQAYKWYALAARSGDKEAARRLEAIRLRLTPGELEAAQDSVARWEAQPSNMGG
jgi:localization factor PodJL